MIKQEFNGKTLDEALSAAARALGTDVTLLSYTILPQSSGGLLSKLFQRGVRLEAWIDSSNDIQAAAREAVRQAMADAQEEKKPRPQIKDRPQEQTQQTKQTARRSSSHSKEAIEPLGQKKHVNQRRDESGRNLNRKSAEPSSQTRYGNDRDSILTDALSTERNERPRLLLTSNEAQSQLKELAIQFVRGFDPTAEFSQPEVHYTSDEEVVVSIYSPALEELLVKSDRLSCAFEHLFKRIAQRKFGDVSGRVMLNAGNAAQLREEKLRQMALDIADKVKLNGKTVTLSSKSSQERRVIHLALEHMDGIATKSVGIGENRKLVVYSTDRAPRNGIAPRRTQGPQNSNRTRTKHTDTNAQLSAQGESANFQDQGASRQSPAPRHHRHHRSKRHSNQRQRNSLSVSQGQFENLDVAQDQNVASEKTETK